METADDFHRFVDGVFVGWGLSSQRFGNVSLGCLVVALPLVLSKQERTRFRSLHGSLNILCVGWLEEEPQNQELWRRFRSLVCSVVLFLILAEGCV
jgi:hypothetical protein